MVMPRKSPQPTANPTPTSSPAVSKASPAKSKKQRFKHAGRSLFNSFTAVFAIFLALASVSLGSAVSFASTISVEAPLFAVALAGFIVSSSFLCLMLRKFVSAYEGAVAKR